MKIISRSKAGRKNEHVGFVHNYNSSTPIP
jgi:hypothetical protein